MKRNYRQAAMVFKALCDPNRLAIIDMIKAEEKCACKILEELHISQPTLSHHMKILCDSGLVNSRREGKWMHYSINMDLFNQVKKLFDINLNTSCCSCSDGCLPSSDKAEINKKELIIDFLYLDVSICERCQATDNSLDEALEDVSNVLKATGIEVKVNKINVLSEELARKHKFLTSPTIRINGRDIQMDYKESPCKSCGDLCGDQVDCRVWIYQGREYSKPPKAMIIEAILKEVYGQNSEKEDRKEYQIPENLKKFYKSIKFDKR